MGDVCIDKLCKSSCKREEKLALRVGMSVTYPALVRAATPVRMKMPPAVKCPSNAVSGCHALDEAKGKSCLPLESKSILH